LVSIRSSPDQIRLGEGGPHPLARSAEHPFDVDLTITLGGERHHDGTRFRHHEFSVRSRSRSRRSIRASTIERYQSIQARSRSREFVLSWQYRVHICFSVTTKLGLFQQLNVLLDPGQRHLKALCQLTDGGLPATELVQDAASRLIRQRRE
jgi:hypothetical protein